MPVTPTPHLDRIETPTLLFGALSHLKHAVCLRARFSADAADCRAWLREIAPHLTYGHAPHKQPATVLALTAAGLLALGLDQGDLDTFSAPFVNGMTSPGRARALGDTPHKLAWGDEPSGVHALLLVYAHSETALQDAIARIDGLKAAKAADIIEKIWLQERDGADQREPFGFRDGLSQPVLPGTPASRRAENRDQLMAAGEFVLGYPDNRGFMPPVPSVACVRQHASSLPRRADGRYDLGRHSSFLVARQLHQDVPGFDTWVSGQASALGQTRDYVMAKLLGRWPNGSSLVRNPSRPGKDADNAFMFAREDVDGLACPIGAHIRRANPRDSLHPEADDPLAIVNRHRILRVGRPYVAAPGGKAEGMLFLCLNADIERQFELVQQSWLLRGDFGGLRNEQDPIIGLNGGTRKMTVPTTQGPQCFTALSTFVTPIGGGYFWLPSRSAIDYLGTDPI